MNATDEYLISIQQNLNSIIIGLQKTNAKNISFRYFYLYENYNAVNKLQLSSERNVPEYIIR